jgi:cell division protein FtsB
MADVAGDKVKKFSLPTWREAAVWAVLAALLFEVGLNLLFRRSIWHRVENLEEQVKSLNHTRELEELRMQNQLQSLRQSQEANTVSIEKVEEKVERKTGIKK